ncbi:MAG: hypothetical protein ACKVTZ_18665 [Bacteroidia bacterium]
MKTFHLLFLLLLTLVSCRKQAITTPTGPIAKRDISEIMADDKTEPQDKYNKVAEMFVLLLEQALVKNDAYLVNDIVVFESNHYFELNSLAEELDDWLKNMDDEERMYAVIDIVRRSHSRKLNYLVPRVEARLKPYPEQRKMFNKLMRTIELRR